MPRNPENQDTREPQDQVPRELPAVRAGGARERVGEYFELDRDEPVHAARRPGPRRPASAARRRRTSTGRRGSRPSIADTNPLFHDLLCTFERLTGTPVIINTSFNVRGEPIVCTPADALRCFLTTGMDVLVMDRFVLRKKRTAQRDTGA